MSAPYAPARKASHSVTGFPLHDEATAPAEALPHLAAARERMGFLTTLNAVMAESPQLLAGYTALAQQFAASSLPKPAQQVVLLTASVANACPHCVAAHSTLALRAGLTTDDVNALRKATTLQDPSLDAVRRLTQAIVDKRGWADEQNIADFLAAGHTRRQILDVVLGIGMKTLSNYTNHIAHTPLDPAWQGQEWTKS